MFSPSTSMQFLLITKMELTRNEKNTIDNCYDTTSDINIYADTMVIVLTINPTLEPQCDFPAGIFVSLQLDGIDSEYEPATYVYDYDYATTKTITINCVDVTNPKYTTCYDLDIVTTG